MIEHSRTFACVRRAVLVAAVAIGVISGCDSDASPEAPEPTATPSQADESSSPGGDESSSADEKASGDEDHSADEEAVGESDSLGGEPLDAEDAAAVVDAVAGTESEDGRRLATNLVIRLAEEGARFDDDAGWRVIEFSDDDDGIRARFESGDFAATFDYDVDADGVEAVDEAASEILAGRDDARPSFSLHPEAYDAAVETPAERWEPEYRKRVQRFGGPQKLEAMSAILGHAELMEDAVYLVVHRGEVSADEYRKCRKSLNCRWSVSSLPDGQFEVAFEGDLDESVEIAWSVDLDSETLSPRNPVARHLHQLRRPIEDLSLPFAESVAFDEGEGDQDEASEDLPRLSDDEINDVINEEFGDIRRCVLSALDDTEPGGSTSWEVEFLIDTRGDVGVDSVVVNEEDVGDITDSEFGDCLKEVFANLEFPPLPTQRGVRYPLHVQ